MFNEHEIELCARNLPGNRRLVMIRFKEIKGTRLFTGGVRELHAVFTYERALLQFFQQPHALKRKVSVGHQRFADVMPREALLFE